MKILMLMIESNDSFKNKYPLTLKVLKHNESQNKNISLCIEDDKYFEVMILSEWGIQKEGKSLYQRTWNKFDA